MKRQQDIQRILEDFKGVRNIPGNQISKEESTHPQRSKTTQGNWVTSRKGIADVFCEFYRLYEDNEKDDSEHEVNDNDNYSNTDVHNNDTEEMTEEYLKLLQKSCKT